MEKVTKKLAATPKRLRLLVSRRRLVATSPRGIRHLSKEALRQHLLNNSLDTLGTRQQMVSRLTTFIKAAKSLSKDQHQENKHRTSVQEITMGTALQPLTAQRPETPQPTAVILTPTARKPQQSHLQNAQGKGRGNAPLHQAPQMVTPTGKGVADATVHPPPPLPLRLLAHPALLVAATHAEGSTSAATTEAGDTLW